MNSHSALPLVSVVTPVYNGERFLDACIQSVLAQTYERFEYVILDNASTDRTAEIIRSHAARDSRIRCVRNEAVLPIMANWNTAMALIDQQSDYCKVVHADDQLLPRCLEEMVAVAKDNPSVVLVGAYRIDGSRLNMVSVPYPQQLVPGAELCRNRLLGRWADVFGSPTSVMYRADRVRARPEFYRSDNPHADTEVCFELLRDGDYGFVHQVLTYTRRHTGAQTTDARRHGTHSAARIMIARDFGPSFLSPAEQRIALDTQIRYHYQFLGANIARLTDSTFRQQQIALLDKCGLELSWWRVTRSAVIVGLKKVPRWIGRMFRS